MTEREMLEFAAKAARLMFDPTVNYPEGLMVVREDAECQSEQVLWNPRHDDGDSFRLLVALGLSLDAHATMVAYGPDLFISEPGFRDRAACRLAILRAAAEIGRAMP